MKSNISAYIPADVHRKRRWQMLFGVIAMMAVSSPQYVWALFVPTIKDEMHASLAAVQITIAIFSICMCGLGPVHGFLAQRLPTRLVIALGGALAGLGWILSAQATTLSELYLTYGVISGLGVGLVYVTASDAAAHWFPDRRGFAVGLVAGSYGFGAVVTTFPISILLKGEGLRHVLLMFGIILGIICVLAALGMRRRNTNEQIVLTKTAVAVRSYSPKEMLATPGFWLLFIMMTMVGTGGLMVISNIGVFAKSFGIGPGTLVLGMAALPLALTLDRIANGFTRPLFGWISDHIGRENTMAFAFTMEAFAILLLMLVGQQPALFVILSAIVFLGWGEIFSLFPATQADMFGPQHQAQNLGFLMVSIAIGSVLGGPLASLIYESTGSWSPVFWIVSGLDLIAAALAFMVLKPMRQKWSTAAPLLSS